MKPLAEVQLLAARGWQALKFVPRRQQGALLLATGIMAVTSGSNTAVALLLGQLVDRVKVGLAETRPPAAILSTAAWVLGTIAVLYVVRELLHVVRRSLVERSLAFLNYDFQRRLADHVLRLDMRLLSQEKVGAQHGRIVRSVDGMVRFVRLLFLDCLPAAFTGGFSLAAAIGKSPLLGGVMLGVAPLSIWLTIRQLYSQRDVRLKLMRDCEELDGTLVEQLSGAEYIRVANTFAAESQRLAATAEKKRQREVRHHIVMAFFGCGKALNEGAFHVLVLALATWLAVHGRISFGDILVFSVLFLNVMTPLNEIHRILDEGHEASLRVADYLQMMAEPVDRSFESNGKAEIRLIRGEPAIHIDNLVTEYITPEGRTRRALDGISLTIAHGETVGIAGRSGCGKSTLVKVLLRLLHPQSGEVRVGGVPLGEISREQLAQIVGYVGQIPFAISGNVVENISYGSDERPPTDLVRAAQMAQFHDDVLQLPGTYAAEVGERGQNLSGGQRQRLALARILMKEAPILILDEATSALDNISERYVQRSLGVATHDRTTILIAHRLSTLRDCSQILVFDAGRIVEVGNFESLLNSGGLFTQLVRSAEEGVAAAP